MRIGVLTYYRVANFGANLQAVSTYKYLVKNGHEPIFIHYMSEQLYEKTDCCYNSDKQIKAHLDFVDSIITNQTETCFTADDVNNAIEKYGIEAIIVGSDAVLQHHPLISRIYLTGNRFRRHFYLEKVNDERLFPNMFWGCDIKPLVKKAYMSVSSQNSAYKFFSPVLKSNMKKAISACTYISVRDTWTQKMLKSVTSVTYPVTPDPVFAFNENCLNLIPSKDYIQKKYGLPDKYVLLSFLNVFLPKTVIDGLKRKFSDIPCVALPTPIGMRFSHNYDYEIPMPLSPIDWYALIKYSIAYIGNNMHPIVVALHNGVSCFSIDNYSNYNIFRHPKNDGASKILDVLKKFGLQNNLIVPFKNNTVNLCETIFDAVESFPRENVLKKSEELYLEYVSMMSSIINSFQQ